MPPLPRFEPTAAPRQCSKPVWRPLGCQDAQLKIKHRKEMKYFYGHFRPLFLYYRLFNTVDSKQMLYLKVCRLLDSNHRSTNWAPTTAQHKWNVATHVLVKKIITPCAILFVVHLHLGTKELPAWTLQLQWEPCWLQWSMSHPCIYTLYCNFKWCNLHFQPRYVPTQFQEYLNFKTALRLN